MLRIRLAPRSTATPGCVLFVRCFAAWCSFANPTQPRVAVLHKNKSARSKFGIGRRRHHYHSDGVESPFQTRVARTFPPGPSSRRIRDSPLVAWVGSPVAARGRSKIILYRSHAEEQIGRDKAVGAAFSERRARALCRAGQFVISGLDLGAARITTSEMDRCAEKRFLAKTVHEEARREGRALRENLLHLYDW